MIRKDGETYEALLAEMEQTPPFSAALATMLSTFRKVTASYWPGLFHGYDHTDLPRTNNDLEQYLVQPATMNGEQQDENRLHQAWWYMESCELLPQSLHVCTSFVEQSFARLISHNGVPCGANFDHRHGARRVQHRFRKSPECYLAVLEAMLIKERLPT